MAENRGMHSSIWAMEVSCGTCRNELGAHCCPSPRGPRDTPLPGVLHAEIVAQRGPGKGHECRHHTPLPSGTWQASPTLWPVVPLPVHPTSSLRVGEAEARAGTALSQGTSQCPMRWAGQAHEDSGESSRAQQHLGTIIALTPAAGLEGGENRRFQSL